MDMTKEATHIARNDAARHGQVAGTKGEFLTFRLGGEEYGIDILRVQEIRSYEQPTRIANTPEFLRGVVNLRGVIVPIVDLRLKLGCGADFNAFTVVIVWAPVAHMDTHLKASAFRLAEQATRP